VEDEEEFEENFPGMFFVTRNSDAKEVELVPDGANTKLTFANRLKYVRLVQQTRLHEFDDQVAAIRRGLATIIPIRALQLCTPNEVELLVCGQADVDIPLMKEHTKYCGFQKTDAVCKRFWRVSDTLLCSVVICVIFVFCVSACLV
jgi:E3 ubiquitin-protein ligase HERC2